MRSGRDSGESRASKETSPSIPQSSVSSGCILPERKEHCDDFPAHRRPESWRDDKLWNKLTWEQASNIVIEYEKIEAMKKERKTKKRKVEKSDDKIPVVMIPAGEDDCRDKVSEARKLTCRPVVKEVKEYMSWMPVKYDEIVRKLPLRTYGLEDKLVTSTLEDCHDLTSEIEIKNFSPTNLRVSANATRQVLTHEEGKFALESEDMFGELETVNDVAMAWNTLAAVRQKLHPHWPDAIIAMKVILTMKMFGHCGKDARKILIEWSNR